MRRITLKRSQVLREGYVQGLKKAQRIINEMLEDDDDEEIEYPINFGDFMWVVDFACDEALQKFTDFCHSMSACDANTLVQEYNWREVFDTAMEKELKEDYGIVCNEDDPWLKDYLASDEVKEYFDGLYEKLCDEAAEFEELDWIYRHDD